MIEIPNPASTHVFMASVCFSSIMTFNLDASTWHLLKESSITCRVPDPFSRIIIGTDRSSSMVILSVLMNLFSGRL